MTSGLGSAAYRHTRRLVYYHLGSCAPSRDPERWRHLGKIGYERDAGSMKRRVVITGMGVVSPNGIGNEAFCRAALAGLSGVERITRFDPSDLPVQIAGEVAGFDELAWVDAHKRQHLSRSVPLALAASTQALEQAGI